MCECCADVIVACPDYVFLPIGVIRVDTVIGSQHAGAVVDSDTTQADGFGASDDAANVLANEQVELASPELLLDNCKFRTLKVLAFALRRNNSELDRPFVVLGNDLLGVVDLVVQR